MWLSGRLLKDRTVRGFPLAGLVTVAGATLVEVCTFLKMVEKFAHIFWRPSNPDHAWCLLHFRQHEPIPRVILAEQHGGELHLQVCVLFISFEIGHVESSCFFSQFNQVNLAYTMSSAAVFSLTPVLLLPTIGYAGVMVLGTALRELNLES